MRRKVLFLGHTGRLGQAFVQNYCDKFEIIGMSRTTLNHPKVRDVQADVTRCNWDYVMEEVGEVDAVIHSVMMRPWSAPVDLVDFTDEQIMEEINLQITSTIKMLRHMKKAWDGKMEGKSIVLVSSTSADGSDFERQFVYSPAKAAMVTIAENTRRHFKGVKVGCLKAGHFPTYMLPASTVAKQVHDLL